MLPSALLLLLYFSNCLTINFPNISAVVPSNPLGQLSGFVSNSTQQIVTGTSNVVTSTKDLISNTKNNIDEEVIDTIYNGLIIYEETNMEIPLLKQTIDKLKIPAHVFRKKIVPAFANTGVCIGCAAAMKYFIVRSRLGLSRNRLVEVLVFACSLFNIESERVCRGAIELNIDILIYIVRENKELNAFKGCSTICQNFGCFKKHRTEWSVNLPNGTSPQRFTNASSDHFYRILQITDLHMDPLYEIGANADCDEPLCCQADQGQASNPEKGAGKWGDYRDCDMPYYALDNFLDQIKTHNNLLEPQFSYIYFTGDIISHRVWNTSRESNTREIKRVNQLFKDNFGEIPIYSILGNHEPHPLDIFSPLSTTSNLSTTWIFDLVANEWADWLPSESLDTIRQGGFYTVLVKPGFRIIGLNSNVCYIYNWWLLFQDNDPFGQLSWLIEVLLEAESSNESVHILSHVPPGDSTCLQEWTRQYSRIVKRFSNTITGQFNGHTHFDEFRVFYDNSTSQIVNVAYNGGSFTPFNNLNPNYRFYDVDYHTQELLDLEEWTYDITTANQNSNSTPNWFKLYNFKDAYNVSSLKPQDIEFLINEMKNDNSLLEKYFRYKVREAKPSLLQGCENSCHKENLCSIISTEADEAAACGGSLISQILNIR